jgi:dihydropteroate synthase
MSKNLIPLKIGPTIFDFKRTYIMGIVNVTPDSFADGGHYYQTKLALKQIEKLIQEGADIIDLGAESTRPGSAAVSVDEEIRRLQPILKAYKKNFSTPLSIDTSKSEVARIALEYGADLINDISAFRIDSNMPKVIAAADVPVVLMHMQGTPRSMQHQPQYKNVVAEITAFFESAIQQAEKAGIHQIILDPGIGFGKTLAHNLQILHDLDKFQSLNKPLLIGTSCKSFIDKIIPTEVTKRLPGTIASNVLAILKGANFVRVHDVAALKQAILVTEAILTQGEFNKV